MMHDPLDLSFLFKVADSETSQATANFKTFNEDTRADVFESGDFFDDTVVGSLVKRDSVLSLIFDLSLRPLLFLCRFSA